MVISPFIRFFQPMASDVLHQINTQLLDSMSKKDMHIPFSVEHLLDSNRFAVHNSSNPSSWYQLASLLLAPRLMSGSSLTLIQEPDAEFVEFQQRFMPEPLEADRGRARRPRTAEGES